MAVTVRTLDNFVGGEWVPAASDDVRTIVSPVTGETIAEAADAGAQRVSASCSGAAAIFSAHPPYHRCAEA